MLDNEISYSTAHAQIESWGYRTIPVSAASGRGLEQLNEVLKDKVSVVAGPSGCLSGSAAICMVSD